MLVLSVLFNLLCMGRTFHDSNLKNLKFSLEIKWLKNIKNIFFILKWSCTVKFTSQSRILFMKHSSDNLKFVVRLYIRSCSSLLSVDVIKASWSGAESFLGLQNTVHHHGKARQQLKAGTCRQELKQRQLNVSFWLASHCLLSLSSYAT